MRLRARARSERFVAPPPRTPVARATRRPTFAVIMAAYQAAATIGDALDSVLSQTLPADEIVVCDDGSTDDIASALARHRDHVTLIRQENAGQPAALNAAIRATSCEFVVNLDADDLYEPRRLEAIAELAGARPDLDLINTDAVAEVAGRPPLRESDLFPFPAEVDAQRRLILRVSYLTCPAIRRERLLALGGFDRSLRIGADWDAWIRLILGGALAGCVNEPLYRYRVQPVSNSSDAIKNRYENIAILEKTLANPSLRRAERRLVRRGIRYHAGRISLAELEQAIADERPEARRLALGVVRGRGFSPTSRLEAVLSILAPSQSRVLLERRAAASGGRVTFTDR